MKVCKKCKKKVANKAKICKYCGADVSKAKIIKPAATNTKKATSTKTTTQSKQKVKTTTNKVTPIKEKNKINKQTKTVTKEGQPKVVEKKESVVKQKQSTNKKTMTETFVKVLVYILLEIFCNFSNPFGSTCFKQLPTTIIVSSISCIFVFINSSAIN